MELIRGQQLWDESLHGIMPTDVFYPISNQIKFIYLQAKET